MIGFIFLLILSLTLLPPSLALAHCPLCTLGAGAAALAATWIGIKTMAVAVFLGAFGLALGLWLSQSLKKQYFKAQRLILGLASFLLTNLPLQPFFHDYGSINIFWRGDYGSWLNRVYVFDRFWSGAVIGALVLFLSPYLSAQLTNLRKGRVFPFQGLIITFSSLLLISLAIQLFL